MGAGLGWVVWILSAAYPVQAWGSTPTEPVADLYARVLRTHVGLGLAFRDDPVLHFRYLRRVPSEPARTHVYLRRGGDRFVEVRQGDVVTLRLGIVGDRAWARGVQSALDPDHVREQADRLGAAVLGPVVRLPPLEAVRTGVKEIPCAVAGLRAVSVTTDDRAPPLLLSVDPDSGRVVIAEVAIGGTRLRWNYGRWKVLGDGRAVPLEVSVIRGEEVVDRIDVDVFDTAPVVPEAWFRGSDTGD